MSEIWISEQQTHHLVDVFSLTFVFNPMPINDDFDDFVFNRTQRPIWIFLARLFAIEMNVIILCLSFWPPQLKYRALCVCEHALCFVLLCVDEHRFFRLSNYLNEMKISAQHAKPRQNTQCALLRCASKAIVINCYQ